MSTSYSFLRWVSYGLATLALASGLILLLGDAKPGMFTGLPAPAISAAPLLLVGVAFLTMQPVIRPRAMEWLKNGLLAATFLLWGTIQLMPSNAASLFLGNVVIVLYVLDLAWVIFGTKSSQRQD